MASKSTIRQKDIAEKAGVSQAAVSLVLSGQPLHDRVSPETRERIERVARELKYFPNIAAQQLRGGKSGLLGVLITSSGARAPVHLDRVAELERVSLKRGYRMLVGQTGSDLEYVEDYVNDFAGRGLDGVICMTHESKKHPGIVPEVLSRLQNVVYLRRPSIGDSPYVQIDGADCILQAVDFLVTKGRRRIGMVILDEVYQAYHERRRGYVEAMKQHNMPLEEDLIWADDGTRLVHPHAPSNAEADKVIEHLVGQNKADAVVAINDDWAAQLIKAIRRRGLAVPGDVAVIGQGNFKIASYFDPEITTLDPQNDLFAEAAVDLLTELIDEGKTSRRSVTVKPKLIVRGSA